MSDYILAIDQGTTSSRAALFDQAGQIRSLSQRGFRQEFPRPGFVEHDPEELWDSVRDSISKALAEVQAKPRDIAGIGLANQRETIVVWDRRDGRPLCNAIVWQDRRTSEYIDELRRAGAGAMIRERTGLVLDAYFSASKLRWILDNVDGARLLASEGNLRVGTVDTWVLWKLTAGRCFATDATNASRTMLFNIHDLRWDPVLLDLFSVPPEVLPEVRGSSEVIGVTNASVFGAEVAIGGIAGDQQASAFGHLCFAEGRAKNTYGTGAFLLLPTGSRVIRSKHDLLTTVAWQRGGEVTYALEGSIFTTGAAIAWLVDGLGLLHHASEIDQSASSVEDNGGVYFVPALAGLGAPYWDQYARGTIVGITRGTTAGHIARATLEGIAYQVHDVVKAVEADIGAALRELRVDGGASRSDFLMQFQADVLDIPVIRPQMAELTSRGAAFLAGLATGFWPDLEALSALPRTEKILEPGMALSQRVRLLDGWNAAVRQCLER